MNSWKRWQLRALFLLLSLALLLALPSYAHPGDLDSKGGHYDRSTGEYHYHHGYPAHQHTGGICPYDFDDQTGKTSGPSTSNSASDVPTVTTIQTSNTDSAPSIAGWFSTLFVAAVFLWGGLSFVIHRLKLSSKFSKFSPILVLSVLVFVCVGLLVYTSNISGMPSMTATQSQENENDDIYKQSLRALSLYAEEADMSIKSYSRYCLMQQYMAEGDSETEATAKAKNQIPDQYEDATAAYIVISEMAQRSKLSIPEYISFCEEQIAP